MNESNVQTDTLELDVYIMWDTEISGQSMQLNLIVLSAKRIEEVYNDECDL